MYDRRPGTWTKEVSPEWIAECAADLAREQGRVLIVAGSHLPDGVHAIAYAINAGLGKYRKTVEFVYSGPRGDRHRGLAEAIGAGREDARHPRRQPGYNAPADLDWAELQKTVAEVVRFGYYVDETSAAAGTHIAAAHYLESWGDARTLNGTVVPIQPMIMPLFGGLTQNEVLARSRASRAPIPTSSSLRRSRRARAGRPEAGDLPQVPARRLLEGTRLPAGARPLNSGDGLRRLPRRR
jgi:hypothetical protein